MSHPTLDIDLNPTIGVLEIGSLLSVCLFGVVTVQCHTYFNRFPNDWWLFKLLVSSIWLLELGHTIGVSYEIYRATITHYGHPEKLVQFHGLSGTVILGGLITMLVQNFFSTRVWRVLPSPYRYLGFACYFISVSRAIVSLYAAVMAFQAKSLLAFRLQWGELITSLLVIGAFVDVTIACAMVYFFAQRRGKATGNVGPLIDRLIGWTIRTGALTSIGAVAMVICFQTMPENFIWLSVYTCLAKLYSNSLLSALNARQSLRNVLSKSTSGVPTTPMPVIPGPPGEFGSISIEMTKTHEITTESDYVYDGRHHDYYRADFAQGRADLSRNV